MNTHKYRDHKMLMNGLIHKKLEMLKWNYKLYQNNKNQKCNNNDINLLKKKESYHGSWESSGSSELLDDSLWLF